MFRIGRVENFVYFEPFLEFLIFTMKSTSETIKIKIEITTTEGRMIVWHLMSLIMQRGITTPGTKAERREKARKESESPALIFWSEMKNGNDYIFCPVASHPASVVFLAAGMKNKCRSENKGKRKNKEKNVGERNFFHIELLFF